MMLLAGNLCKEMHETVCKALAMPDVIISPGQVTQALPAYLAIPDAAAHPGERPGVVLIHEAFGLTPDMREHADWFASEGFLAVVPDLFSRGGMRRCIRAVTSSMRTGSGQAVEEINAARDWLAAREDCTASTGIAGFCMGGGFAILLASDDRWDASSVAYGQLPKDLDEAVSGSCPVVASYGGKDYTLRGAGPKLESAYARAGVEHDVKVYPGATHAFMSRRAERTPLNVISNVTGLRHDPAATADARARISAFFTEHLSA